MRVAGLVATVLLGGTLLAPLPARAQQEPSPAPPVEAGVAPAAPVPDPRPGAAFADPSVAALQRTADRVQSELAELAGRITAARERADAAAAEAGEARQRRRKADAALAARQDEIDRFTRSVFAAMGRADEFRVLVTAANPRELLDGASLISQMREEQQRRLTAALHRQRRAAQAERAALDAERAAAARAADLEQRRGDAVNRADAISAELRAPIEAANAAVIEQQRAQRERNASTARSWRAYLDRLEAAGITPPPADALRDPASLPAGLGAVPGARGRPQAGVAEVDSGGRRLLVLPKETVEAVSAGIAALGKPYVPHDGGEGPAAYSCDGLVRAAFARAGVDLPASARRQLARGRTVPLADAQPGDLVFLGPARYGVQSVGIVLDDRTMLAAHARLSGVVVTDLPHADTVLGVVRPSLGRRPEPRPVPERAEGELTWRCGGVEVPARKAVRETGGGAASYPAAAAWGGYPNGLIPSSALCGIGVGSHALRCDAAQAFVAMSRAYAGRFGHPICVTDSYRTFPAQIDLYRRKPALAAVPGTSNHGWGLAVDLCGGAESFGTPQYAWLAANGPRFGWVNPAWARPGGGREEPWHWEYAGHPG